MANEFDVRSATVQMNYLIAQHKKHQANKISYEADDDAVGASDEIQAMADIEQKISNLSAMAQREQAKMSASVPRYDAYKGKKHEEMNPTDIVHMIRDTSKYGKDLTYDEYNRGLYELQAAKAKGDYHGKP
jgi:hypothetical protein